MDTAVEDVFECFISGTAIPAENRPPPRLAQVGETGTALSIEVTKTGAPHKAVIIHPLSIADLPSGYNRALDTFFKGYYNNIIMRDSCKNRLFALCRMLAACTAVAVLSGCVTAGMVEVAYANMSLQDKADRLDNSQFDKQNALYQKAVKAYLKGRDKALKILDKKYPGFKEEILSGDQERVDAAVTRLEEEDVPAAYWGGSGWLGAFSLNPLDDVMLAGIIGAPALLETGLTLDPGYSNGAIYDVLLAWYASAPAEFGGNGERAQQCFDEEIRLTKGISPVPYVTWANSWCISRQDLAGFTEALNHAVSLKAGAIKGMKIMDKLAQRKARWLLEHTGDFFLVWEE
jgi:predicted anti-sigma-YlaC factor YlaD